MQEPTHRIDLYDLHHYVASVKDGPLVGDVIKNFHATCGGAYCEGCGKSDVSAGTCKGCHVASYCTVECQQRDWKEGGHSVECDAITTGDHMTLHTEATPVSIVAARHLARCSALALAKSVCAKDETELEVPTPTELSEVHAHVGSFLDGMQLTPVERNWMAGAVKHPGSFRNAAAHADKGKYKGRTTAFAHHVLSNSDHKHNSGLLRKRAALALTFAKFRRHGGRGGK
jgi:hypothetical protein